MKNLKLLSGTLTAAAMAINCFSSVINMDMPNAHAARSLDNAQKVVEYAKSKDYISYLPNEVTEYFNSPYMPWCMGFVLYCAAGCDMKSSVPNTTFCPIAVDTYKSWSQWEDSINFGGSYTPVIGDNIFFDYECDGTSDHVGFVLYSDNEYVYTIEGNSSDRVEYNYYRLDDGTIMGYGLPDYECESEEPENYGEITDNNIYEIESSVGAWLRSSSDFGNNLIGIVANGSQLRADKSFGEWVHFDTVYISGINWSQEGWINKSVLKQMNFSENTNQNTTIEMPSNDSEKLFGMEYRISSEIGAWFRTSPDYTEWSKICVLNTDSIIEVISRQGDWFYAKTSLDGINYTFGYIHYSTVRPATYYTLSDSVEYKVNSVVGCWLRDEPEIADNKIRLLNYNEVFEVKKIVDDWAYVRISFKCGCYQSGWVHTANISPLNN